MGFGELGCIKITPSNLAMLADNCDPLAKWHWQLRTDLPHQVTCQFLILAHAYIPPPSLGATSPSFNLPLNNAIRFQLIHGRPQIPNQIPPPPTGR